MIIEWLWNIGAGIVTWLGTLIPTWPLPGWFTGFGNTLNGFFGYFDGFGAWGNWPVITAVIGSIVSFFLLIMVGRLALFLYRLLPFSGGS